MDDSTIHLYLATEGCNWIFNAPHTSHAGRVWEQMIGAIRRIFHLILVDLGLRCLSHEVLTTLIAEVTAIVNAIPLYLFWLIQMRYARDSHAFERSE